ncbi:MAG: hypothetical protein WCV67_09865 [Victivallaceae bacterium]|jgi:prepilin-type processing-associated H-X9-DG protein
MNFGMRFIVFAVLCLACWSLEAKNTALPDTSFDAVTDKLDKNGTMFIYFSPDSSFKLIAEHFKLFRRMVADKDDIKPDDKKAADDLFEFISILTDSSGVPSIDGIGLSSVQTGKKMFRGRLCFHKREESGPGMIWSVLNESPQTFYLTEIMPADTVYAAGWFFQPKIFWKWLEDAAEQSKSEKAQHVLSSIKKSLDSKEISWDSFLDCFEGEFDILLLADSRKKHPVKSGTKTIELEQLDFAMVCGVKDDTVFKALRKGLNLVQPPVGGESSKLRIEIPFSHPDLPWLKPVIVQEDNRLFLASNIETVERLLKLADLLKNTEAFKALADNIPLKGNSFEYLSARLVRILVAAFKQSSESQSKREFAESVEHNFAVGFFGVCQVTEDGFISTFNVTSDPAALLAAKTVLFPAALNAGMLFPMFNNIVEKNRRDACAARLKELGFVLKMYAMNNQDHFPETGGAKMMDELVQKGLLKDRSKFYCPSGKPYAYIGGYMETSSKDIPLLFDFPGNHGGTFTNVFFLDGRVQGYEMRLNSCVELINFLHRQFNYPPELYRQLLEKAAQLDSGK